MFYLYIFEKKEIKNYIYIYLYIYIQVCKQCRQEKARKQLMEDEE